MSDLLTMHLSYAVPLAIAEMQAKPGILRALRGQQEELALAVATFGDAMLYRSADTAPAIAALTQALAMLAFQPEGVTFAGLHFEATLPTREPVTAGKPRQATLWE